MQDLVSGLQPRDIKKKYKLSDRQLSYYLKPLKEKSLIKKKGFGTWEVNIFELKKLLTISTAYPNSQPLSLVSSSIRGHAFIFTIEYKGVSWENILKDKGVAYKFLPQNKVFRIVLNNRKIWLSSKGIVVFWDEGESIFSTGAYEARREALSQLFKLLYDLKTSLGLFKDFSRFSTRRQHYGKVHDTLARLYEEKKSKLKVVDEKDGLWLLIDNSLNLHELEAVHRASSPDDSEGVVAFLNDLRVQGYPLMSEVLRATKDNADNQAAFNSNLQSHIKAVQDLGSATQDLKDVVKVALGDLPRPPVRRPPSKGVDVREEIKRIFRDVT